MDEYIKRSEAINEYQKSYRNDKHRTLEASLVHKQEHNHILHILHKLPAADVVEVVRCKNCKKCDSYYPNKKIGEEPEIEYFCKSGKHKTTADDFCSYGERRSENAEM